jgi:hypothetical protein
VPVIGRWWPAPPRYYRTPQQIAFRGAAQASANSSSAAVVLPAVDVGDGMLLLLAIGSTVITATDPSGWALVDAQDRVNIRARLYQRVAQAGDAGSTVTIPLSGTAKWALPVAAWSGTDTASIVAAEAALPEPGTSATHVTPVVYDAAEDAWEVQMVADRGTVTASTTVWTPPAGMTMRQDSYLAGTSCASAAIGDSNGPVPVGTVGGDTWTSDFSTSSAVGFTVVLLPFGVQTGSAIPGTSSQYAAYF